MKSFAPTILEALGTWRKVKSDNIMTLSPQCHLRTAIAPETRGLLPTSQQVEAALPHLGVKSSDRREERY
jgi:hypothetical protein